MDKEKRARLEAHGWRVGSAQELLGLSAEEAALVELRLKLSRALRELRAKKHLTQAQLAELLHSSQSRVAKVEAADESVSLDLLIRSLLALGASRQELAGWIGAPGDDARSGAEEAKKARREVSLPAGR